MILVFKMVSHCMRWRCTNESACV